MNKRNNRRARPALRLSAICILALAIFLPRAASADALTRGAASAEIRQLPAYAVMAEHYPTEYAQVLDIIVDGLTSGRRFSDIVLDATPIVAQLVVREGPKANIENTLALMRLTRVQAKALEAIDPKLCLVLLGSAKADKPLGMEMPAVLFDQELVLTANLLRQTATAPEPPPTLALSEKAIEAIAIEAYGALPGDELRVAIRQTEGDPSKASTPLQQTAYCEFSMALFDILLKMPPVEATSTFKAMNLAAAQGR